MPNVVRTRNQLFQAFHNNVLGEILAQDGRDLVTSAFGFPATTDPTPDWDNVDSAGVGAFFDVGSVVIQTTTQVEWRCYSGTPHLAIWWPAYNGVPPSPPTRPARIELIDVAFFVPVTSLSTLNPNGVTLLDGMIVMAEQTGNPSTWGIYVARAGAWTRVPWLPAGLAVDGPITVLITTIVVVLLPVVVEVPGNTAPLFEINGQNPPPYGVPWVVGTDHPNIGLVGTQIQAFGDGIVTVHSTPVSFSNPLQISLTGIVPAAQVAPLDASKIVSGTFDAARIPNLPASIITSGTFDVARIPSLPGSIITSGTLDVARIPNLPASIITSGTFDVARIPNLPASIITSGTFDVARIPNLPASIITSGTFDAARIPNLPASIITSGTFDAARIPSLPASIITSGTFDAARIPSLAASIITSGTFDAARLPIMVASGGSHAPGAVPDPPSSSGSSKFLREDATWAAPSGGSTLTTDTYTGTTTTNVYSTLFDFNPGTAILGSWCISNTGANPINVKITVYDLYGTNFGPFVVTSNAGFKTGDEWTNRGTFGAVPVPTFSRVKVEIAETNAGQGSTYDLRHVHLT